ncbi:MAG: 16S rRNA (cytosine(1402)-N(4))-methyltransferase RsmH [Caldisericia bacterium]|nr:16S rRNA (cytosine(1402)-N(4))-methyltransferase RsmH [Caldisericia bacterium]
MMEIVHKPVLLKEVLSFIDFEKMRVFLDLTIGEGGHSEEILKRASSDSILIGFDLDEEILNITERRLSQFGKKFYLFNENYKNFPNVLKKLNINKVDFMLLDLGFSSYQLKEGRGFSFLDKESLHMGYSKSFKGADYYINRLSKQDLIYIFEEFGEIKESEKIALKIIEERKKKKIETSYELAKIIEKVIKKRGKIHPATTIFQAIRIYVNRELDNLKEFLLIFSDYLDKEGIAEIISYHSLEDRMVKKTFKELEEMEIAKILTKKVITPTREEIIENRRSRSAKLRVVQKI